MEPASKEEIATLRALLRDGTDDQLAAFLDGYTRGHLAGMLIASMSSNTRLGFFTSMRSLYPEARVQGTD